MFTIVIPLFNKEKYIRRTIDSVLSQDFGDFEIIIVNDGSTDDSVTQIQGITDSRLRLINQANQGVGAARNTGISNASTDWIALLDADDVWASNHLSELRNIIKDFPSSGMVATQHLSIDTDSIKPLVRMDSEDAIRSIDYFLEASKNSAVVWTSSVAIRKDVFEKIGGFNNKKMGEDLEYWARIALSYPIAISEKVTSYYSRGTGGTTESFARNKFRKIKSLNDISPPITLLIERASNDPSILENPIIKAYINSIILSGVKARLYAEDILAAKNLSRLVIPQRNVTFFTLYAITVTPKIILKKVITLYKNRS